MNSETPTPYRTLDDISRRKEELRQLLLQDSSQVAQLWNGVFAKRENTSRSDYINNIISNGILAIDIFFTLRKLHKKYKGLMRILGKRKRHSR